MIAALLLMTIVAQRPTAACPMPPLPSSLDQAMARTLTSVRSNNAGNLLGQMSHSGVAFGAQGGVVPYAALSDQFANRRGHYCDLFVCGAKAGWLNGLFTGGKTQKTLDIAHGRGTVVLNGHSSRELDLGYIYTRQCTWELISIGAS